MKCPNCQHISDTALLKCSNRGEAYDRAALEKFQHVEFLLTWLDARRDLLGANLAAQLRDDAQKQLDALREEMHLAPTLTREIAIPAPKSTPARETSPKSQRRRSTRSRIRQFRIARAVM